MRKILLVAQIVARDFGFRFGGRRHTLRNARIVVSPRYFSACCGTSSQPNRRTRRLGRRTTCRRSWSCIAISINTRSCRTRKKKRPPEWPQELQDAGHQGDDERRRPRRRRRARKRRGQGRCCCGPDWTRLPVTEQTGCRTPRKFEPRTTRSDGRRDARLRSRHAHDEPHRRGSLSGGASRSLVGHAGVRRSSRPKRRAAAPRR